MAGTLASANWSRVASTPLAAKPQLKSYCWCRVVRKRACFRLTTLGTATGPASGATICRVSAKAAVVTSPRAAATAEKKARRRLWVLCIILAPRLLHLDVENECVLNQYATARVLNQRRDPRGPGEGAGGHDVVSTGYAADPHVIHRSVGP